MSENRITVGSLFSGIGLGDLGLQRAGMTITWQVEIDDFCRKVLAKHWPNVERYEDVRECGAHNLESVDLVFGGDPCQENSAARQRTGLSQKSLGGEFIRIVAERRPRIVLRENPARVRSDAPWPWFRFRSELESLGYVVLPFRLRACCFGLEHQRDRLFLLATFPDAVRQRLQGNVIAQMERAGCHNELVGGTARRHRRMSAPRLRGTTDGCPSWMERLRGLGNAIPPAMTEWLGRRIVEADSLAGATNA